MGLNSTEGYYRDQVNQDDDDGFATITLLMFVILVFIGSFLCGWKAARKWYNFCQDFPWTMVIAAGVGFRIKWYCDTGVQYNRSEGTFAKETQCARPNADPRVIEQMTINAIRDELRLVYRLTLLRNWTKSELVELLRSCRAEDEES